MQLLELLQRERQQVDHEVGHDEVMIRTLRSGALGDVPLIFDVPMCCRTLWTGAPPAVSAPKQGRQRFEA